MLYKQSEKFSLTVSKFLANIYVHLYEDDAFKIFTRVKGLVKFASTYQVEVKKGNLRVIKRTFRVDEGDEILPQTEYCSFIAECGMRFGKRMSKIVPQNFRFIEFLNKFEYTKKFKEVRKVLLNWRQVLTGGFDTSFSHLLKFCVHTKKHTPITAEELINMCERNNFAWLKQPLLDGFSPVDLNKVRLKMDSKPGFFTSKIFGYIRRFSYKRSIKIAVLLLSEIFERPMMYTGLWELGGREKDINLEKDGVTSGTRIVMMCEEVLTIISAYFVQLFTKHIQRIERNCLFIGRKYDYENIKYFKELNEHFDFSLDGDWDNFDANVMDEYILAACAMLRRSLPEDKKYTRYFFFIAASLIIKFIAVPPNRVYKIIKGIPSGHGFTTIIGTYVNYLYFMQLGEMIYGKGNVRYNMNIVVSGDDVKAWFKYHPNLLNINNYVDMIIPSECGDLLRNLAPCNVKNNCLVYTKFLKRRVDCDFNVYWDRESFFRKVIYSKRSFRYYSEILNWMKMWIETAPFDEEINQMCLEYVKYVSKDGTTLYDTNKKFLYSMIEEDFERIKIRGMLKILCPSVDIFDRMYVSGAVSDVESEKQRYALSSCCSEVDLICHALINFGAGPITFYQKQFMKKVKDWSFMGLVQNKGPPAYMYLVLEYYRRYTRQYVHGFVRTPARSTP